jgi:NAD(P)-dependent dehydrogenase (short-subunit alcohol dehydrogenase family)
MKRLAGKVALVTGGGSGIGHASALALAEDGATVAIADVNVTGGQDVAGEIEAAGGRAAFFRTDATQESEIAALMQNIIAKFGRLDCTHNNVGLGKSGAAVIDETLEDWDWTMNLSLKSTFLCMKHEIPIMLAAGGGSIVNTASMAGVLYTASASPSYSAAKAAVIHLTKYASDAYAARGVRVNSIAPGLVATPVIATMFSLTEQASIAAEHQVIARAVKPSEIADAVVYLCSDRSAMVTGVNLPVCGGAR